MQADFDLIRALLEEAHPGLYRYSTKSEWDAACEARRGKLSRAMAKREFLAVVAETLATIRCGHTSWEPDTELQKEIANARLFPLRVMPERKRLMVLLNDTPDDRTVRPGMELLEINGHRPAEILDRIWQTEIGRRRHYHGKKTIISAVIRVAVSMVEREQRTFLP